MKQLNLKCAALDMKGYLTTNAVVGRSLADQLLLPMALAGGGSFISMAPTNHFTTNWETICQFLPATLGKYFTESRSSRYEITRL
ncbi:MAG: RNA 3'-terminal phosphate cyclase [Akkermansiaceae bacterium]